MYRLLLLFLPLGLFAHLNIAVTYPYIGSITKAIGKEHVNTVVLAKGNWDPHFVVPRPSLIAKIRNADALIINGGQLEIGWVPPLVKRASNPKVRRGSAYFLDLSQSIDFLDKPKVLDRAQGDVHPAGNPHFQLDPNNILILAKTIEQFLISIDGEHREIYEKNYAEFSSMWKKKLIIWQERMQDKKGLEVIQYHNNLAYFNHAYGLTTLGTIEPLPGIPPSAKHIIGLIKLIKEKQPCCILHDVYHSTKTAKFIANKTDIKIIVMPHDIGALEEITDLVALFDYLTEAIK